MTNPPIGKEVMKMTYNQPKIVVLDCAVRAIQSGQNNRLLPGVPVQTWTPLAFPFVHDWRGVATRVPRGDWRLLPRSHGKAQRLVRRIIYWSLSWILRTAR